MAYFGKEYKFVSQENFDGFLRAVGLPEDEIPKLLEYKPNTKLVKNGDTYTHFLSSPEGVKETSFKSGVEFDDTIGDKKIKNTYTIDGNTVTQTITSGNGTGKFVREYNGDDMVLSITSSKFDGVAKRWYKAV